jgi:hypothetical protein
MKPCSARHIDNMLCLDLVGDVALVVDTTLEVLRSGEVARAAGNESYVDNSIQYCKFYNLG